MSRAHAVIVEDDLRIPAEAFTFASFRRWVASDAFPESGRIDFLAGAIEVDMSAENLLTHGIIKSEIVGVFRNLVAHRGLGEIVSDSSVNKDTVRLPPLYAKAGVPELWLVDARGDELSFRIHTLEAGGYKPVRTGAGGAGGWQRSLRLGLSFRLTRLPTPIGTWRYVLESKRAAAASRS